MNLPNKITVSRVCLIPIFLMVMAVPFHWGTLEWLDTKIPVTHFVGAVIFAVASMTDWIDGHYARKMNLVTNFGKFLDPLADKLLVSTAFILLVGLQLAPAWIVIIIIAREFAVTGLRLILAEGGEVVAANMLGKIKTWTQIIAILLLLLHNFPFAALSFRMDLVALWVALVFTIWSGIDYFYLNRKVFAHSK
ncbi:CDP-diacylglycerol--glycerol-3-phosphate 3-phosphatidyltransferase [Weizmannia acidilactici]|uniref:CDP-diacylglycerol--glycerol-3-phosphate 3-phosphatidyltransferase n=1 Tax=Weizmannia acidilactici TaxID=2607726 RepID=A0A5J4J211_9BACI|nr:CDP-diacylglycerol--glycerol-3-phosphate 3-phosphatidyltransferase [Weizmannia acidilactici]GER65694.1 CDP-diacylglycerol--glycerol-3-phosphate 3-phosphatidyltransferase [Weizmannia acidilactici]GER68976.1 CDP-diacylglycerol--glycerol-3-phosphate 3-phosphatidyltransferase [Weizmannia acidilactici]GER72051.1 CDP-diacylglycerol--glycerol-3-phosphate 3-phosphatidyltransferase [Weizmannia acidilactici]